MVDFSLHWPWLKSLDVKSINVLSLSPPVRPIYRTNNKQSRLIYSPRKCALEADEQRIRHVWPTCMMRMCDRRLGIAMMASVVCVSAFWVL